MSLSIAILLLQTPCSQCLLTAAARIWEVGAETPDLIPGILLAETLAFAESASSDSATLVEGEEVVGGAPGECGMADSR